MYKLNDVLSYFMMNEWKFKDDNLVNMYKSLSPTDRIIYNCDIESLKWDRYVIIWAIGLRRYIIKDGLKHTNYARKKYLCLKIINYIVPPLYLYCLWKVFSLCLFVVSAIFSFLSSSLSVLIFN